MKKWLALILILCLLPIGAFADEDEGYALISNAKITDRLNLRKAPSSDSETLGRFYNGTVVEVMEKGETWSYVRVGYRLWGYMMNEYLTFFSDPDGFALGGEMEGWQQNVFCARLQTGAAVYDSMNTRDMLQTVTGDETVYVLGDINDDWLLCSLSQNWGSVYVRRQDIIRRYNDALAVVVSSKPESMISLRADARDSAKVLGKYYGGTVVSVLETRNGFSHVAVIGEGRNYSTYDAREQSGFLEGWIKLDYLRLGARADWIGMDNCLTLAYVKALEAAVYDHDGNVIGMLAQGMRMLVLGYAGEDGFYHVDTGDGDPVLIKEKDVEILTGESTPGDMPVLGYGVIRDRLPYEETWGFVPWYEYCDKDAVCGELWDDAMVAVLSVGNQWVQVYRRGEDAYIPRENVNLYLLDECMGDAQAAAGTYHVGTEYFREGLYTFTGETGDEMTVTYADGKVRSFGAAGGSYTLYLHAGDMVTLTGGLLAPLAHPEMLLTAKQDTYAGSGRYLCGEQLRSGAYWDYQICPLNPDEESWYEISTLSHEIDGDGYCTRVSLSEDQSVFDSINSTQLITLYDGEMLEFHNCILRIHFGNG